MAYHGAVLGVFVVGFVFVKTKKINFRELNDLIFPVIPLGYTFGRIANFINQELWNKGFKEVTLDYQGLIIKLYRDGSVQKINNYGRSN